MPPRESNIIAAIRKHYRGDPQVYIVKTSGGPYGMAGVPDLLVCARGRFVALEAKVLGKKPTRLQEFHLVQITRAGGGASIVYSVADACAVIDPILTEDT